MEVSSQVRRGVGDRRACGRHPGQPRDRLQGCAAVQISCKEQLVIDTRAEHWVTIAAGVGDGCDEPLRMAASQVTAPDAEVARLQVLGAGGLLPPVGQVDDLDRKSTRLNSSHTVISYAVFCLKKKKK